MDAVLGLTRVEPGGRGGRGLTFDGDGGQRLLAAQHIKALKAVKDAALGLCVT